MDRRWRAWVNSDIVRNHGESGGLDRAGVASGLPLLNRFLPIEETPPFLALFSQYHHNMAGWFLRHHHTFERICKS